MLDLSVGSGVTTPDELRISVYDDAGALWNDTRVPASGALVPESPAHLGTVLIQPGAAQGALRVHARGLAVSVRVADGVLTIPAGSRGTFPLRLGADMPVDGDDDGVPDPIDDCTAVANPNQGGCPGGAGDDAGDAARDTAADIAPDDGGSNDVGGGGMDAFSCESSGACNRAIGATCADGVQCASSFCVDGVCCANACLGPLPFVQSAQQRRRLPALCAGDESSRRVHRRRDLQRRGCVRCSDGRGRRRTASCARHHGLHGPDSARTAFCCNAACDGTCRTCETGTCVDVKRRQDPPECTGTMTCNATRSAS